ncbi:MAG: tellurite resistance TerB family protein [Myxococcales bacterium]|nr:tellurite resistance TerB family protein [Myxococcales bacterium]
MPLDDATAAALAAWAQFDDHIKDDLLRAVAAAFALVVTADGEVAPSELESFVELAHAPGAFGDLPRPKLYHAFRGLCEAMVTDTACGRARALGLVEKLRGDRRAQRVRHAAYIAIGADARHRAPEDAAYRDVCAALGLEPTGE